MTQIWAICNGKGGVGKSPTAVALAYTVARAGKRVLLIDTDSQGSATYHLLGKKYKSLDQTVYDAIKDRTLGTYVKPIPIRVSRFEGTPAYNQYFSLLPANDVLQEGEDDLIAGDGTFIYQYHLQDLINKYYAKEADVIIIDTPGSHISVYTLMALRAATKVLVPVKTEIAAVEGTVDTMTLLKNTLNGLNRNLIIWGLLPTQLELNNQHHRDALSLMHTYFKMPNDPTGQTFYPVYQYPSLKRNHYNKAAEYRCDVREVPPSGTKINSIASGSQEIGIFWDQLATDLLLKDQAPSDPNSLLEEVVAE